MNYGLITSRTGEYDGEFDSKNYAPDPENTPLFRAIFWSLIFVVVVGAVFGWIV